MGGRRCLAAVIRTIRARKPGSAPGCGGSDPGLSHIHRPLPHQFLQLGRSEFPPLSFLEFAQQKPTQSDPLEHGDLLADGSEHHADLSLPALMDGDAVRVGRLAEEYPHPRGPCHLFLNLHPLLQPFDIHIGEAAGGGDPVLLLVLESGMRQFVRQLSVVCEYQ